MNIPAPPPVQRPNGSPDLRPRRDSAGERSVEISIDLQRYCGTRYAAVFLRENGMEFDTALRALTRPSARRNLVMD